MQTYYIKHIYWLNIVICFKNICNCACLFAYIISLSTYFNSKNCFLICWRQIESKKKKLTSGYILINANSIRHTYAHTNLAILAWNLNKILYHLIKCSKTWMEYWRQCRWLNYSMRCHHNYCSIAILFIDNNAAHCCNHLFVVTMCIFAIIAWDRERFGCN